MAKPRSPPRRGRMPSIARQADGFTATINRA